jgi:chlorite dismutase
MVLDSFLQILKQNDVIHFDTYQVYPLNPRHDFLVWSSVRLSETYDVKHYFNDLAKVMMPYRTVFETSLNWWGMTRPSDYSRGKSAQEIDPFDTVRSDYLVLYPFSKTAEWYKLSRDTRQGMMNEHIRIGHKYTQIKQLLLYSIGLQDQEFIVTYETEDLNEFSLLVTELRSSEARRFTLLDTPLFTALHKEFDQLLELFAGEA